MAVRGNTRLHDLAIRCMLRAPLSFYHTNPTASV
jgi:hypothetical protein